MDGLFSKPLIKINAYASEVQYFNKLLPIWDELPEDLKGEFSVHPRLDGVAGFKSSRRPNQEGILMVASTKDSKWAKDKFIYVEHGAGQTYNGKNWYSDTYRPNMIAAMVPGPYCAHQTYLANPHAAVIPMGAPHLREVGNHNSEKGIVFSWHWRCGIAPESGTAFDEYHQVMPIIKKQGFRIAGHGHPRILQEIRPVYDSYGVPVLDNPIKALRYAGLLIADNTSLMYEAAALDIPVIAVNSQNYRKDVNHGLRFWEAIPGMQVNTPQQLVSAIHDQASGGHLMFRQERLAASNLVYGPNPLDRLEQAVGELCKVVDAYANSY